MTAETFINNVRALPDTFDVKAAIKDSIPQIVAANKKRIVSGKKADGTPIKYLKPRDTPTNSSGSYSRQYSNIKSKRGGQTAFVDLKVDGTFIDSINGEAVDEGLKITFDDDSGKVKGIIGNYSTGIVGVMPSELSPKEIVNQIRKSLFNGL